jgi:hypothetical protein
MPSAPGSDIWIRAFGRTWQLRDAPASVWMLGATSPDMAGIFPGLIRGRDAHAMNALWGSHRDVEARCRLAAQRALGYASGREWFWAYNLIKESYKSWTHLNGKLVREGVRADRTPLPDWLDASYTMFHELLHEEAALKAFDMRLRQVPASSGAVAVAMSSKTDLMAFAAD